MTWPAAGSPPNNNVIGLDPQLIDPEHGDFRPAPGSPALGYGCPIFPARRGEAGSVMNRPESYAGHSEVYDAPGDLSATRTDPAAGISAEPNRRQSLWVSGVITTDTTWDADTVRVTGELAVADGATLTIEPGVLVLFDGYFALEVQGCLLAIGTPEARIRFDSADAEDWTTAPNASGAWGGIRFHSTREGNGRSRLEWCDVQHTKGLAARQRGGALSLVDCSGLDVRNCRFRRNAADYGAVLFCEHMACPTMAGSLLTDNYAYIAGSAVYCIDSYPHLTENTITANVCLNPEYMYDTAAVHNHLSKCWMVGNIVYGNASNYFIPTELREPKPFTVRYCDVRYGIDGEGDFDAAPLFVGSGADPHRLDEASPCRNTGPSSLTGLELLPFDLAGTLRVIDGRIDVGAYEAGDAAGAPEDPVPDAPGPAAVDLSASSLACIPNPMTTGATFRLHLPAAARLCLTVHDVTGRQLAVLRDERTAAGNRLVRWNGSDDSGRRLTPGVYFVRLTLDRRTVARTEIVILD